MKKSIGVFLIIFLGCHSSLTAQPGIHFRTHSFDSLRALAANEHKLLFIDCYTDWCGPCKWMDKNVYQNDTTGDTYNEHFISAKIDMEKGQGAEIRTRYEVTCYPTYLFIDSNGNLIHRASGAMPVDKFVQLGKDALSSKDNFAARQSAYTSGKLDAAGFVQYLGLRNATCLPVQDEIASYFSDTAGLYKNPYTWIILRDYQSDPHSSAIRYLSANRTQYAALHTADSVALILERSWGGAFGACLYKKGGPDTITYQKLRIELMQEKLPFQDRLLLRSAMAYCEIQGDWPEYEKKAVAYISRFVATDAFMLNNTAWVFYEHSTDPAYLDSALSWSARAVAIDPNYYFVDTYAALLYKRGRMPDAKREAERAIALAKEGKIDCAGTEELLRKIKKGK